MGDPQDAMLLWPLGRDLPPHLGTWAPVLLTESPLWLSLPHPVTLSDLRGGHCYSVSIDW